MGENEWGWGAAMLTDWDISAPRSKALSLPGCIRLGRCCLGGWGKGDAAPFRHRGRDCGWRSGRADRAITDWAVTEWAVVTDWAAIIMPMPLHEGGAEQSLFSSH